MNMRKIAVAAVGGVFVLALAWRAEAAVKTEVVEYRIGSETFEGYLAYDDSTQAKRPGIVVYHAWTGVGANEKKHAEMLAQLGYVAFVADVYGKGVHPTPPKESAAEAGKYMNNRPLLRARANAGLDQLRKNPLVDQSKIAAIGYCFGGASVLELARSGADIRGVVTFHGSLSSPTPDDAKNIKGRVLVLHGADDPNVGPDEVDAFAKEMKGAHIDWEMVAYRRTVHAFTDEAAGNDNSRGAAYNKRADERSWMAMQEFFKEIF